MRISRRFLPLILGTASLGAWLSCAPLAYGLGPKCDVFVGYSRLTANSFYSNVSGLNGWTGAMNCKVKPFIGIEGDVAQYGMGSASSIPRTTTYMGGPRVTVGSLGVHVFGHALGGFEHSGNSSGTPISASAFTYALGGGVDIRFLPFFAWRVGADYLNAPSLSTIASDHARVSTGIVFRF
jgi:hypothetical protein